MGLVFRTSIRLHATKNVKGLTIVTVFARYLSKPNQLKIILWQTYIEKFGDHPYVWPVTAVDAILMLQGTTMTTAIGLRD